MEYRKKPPPWLEQAYEALTQAIGPPEAEYEGFWQMPKPQYAIQKILHKRSRRLGPESTKSRTTNHAKSGSYRNLSARGSRLALRSAMERLYPNRHRLHESVAPPPRAAANRKTQWTLGNVFQETQDSTTSE